MYSAELAYRPIPRELDESGAGVLKWPVFLIWRLSATQSGHLGDTKKQTPPKRGLWKCQYVLRGFVFLVAVGKVLESRAR